MDRRVNLFWINPTEERLINIYNIILNLTDDEKKLFERFVERILLNKKKNRNLWVKDWRNHTEYRWTDYTSIKAFSKKLGITESELHLLICRLYRTSLTEEYWEMICDKLDPMKHRSKVKTAVKWALGKMLDDCELIDLMEKYKILNREDYDYDHEFEKKLSQGEKNKRYKLLYDPKTDKPLRRKKIKTNLD